MIPSNRGTGIIASTSASKELSEREYEFTAKLKIKIREVPEDIKILKQLVALKGKPDNLPIGLGEPVEGDYFPIDGIMSVLSDISVVNL